MSQGHLRTQEIVTNILDLAESRGLSRVTTASLARRLGFTEAALYRYFPSKDSILAAALNHLAEELFAGMTEELDPAHCDDKAKVRTQLEGHIARFTSRGGLLVELLLSPVVNGGHELHETANAFLSEYSNRMRVCFEQLQERGTANPSVPSAELSNLWTCQLLGGYVRCRLTRDRWEPEGQDSFLAFIARLQRNVD